MFITTFYLKYDFRKKNIYISYNKHICLFPLQNITIFHTMKCHSVSYLNIFPQNTIELLVGEIKIIVSGGRLEYDHWLRPMV